MSYKITFGGDFCPVAPNADEQTIHLQESLWNDILPIWQNSDFNAINLECPLTDAHEAILKTGPALKGTPETAQFLKESGIDLACLANNHIADFGQQGLRDTLKNCQKAGLATTGIGMNQSQASQTFYHSAKEHCIAFVNFTENEWSTADQQLPGANPMDLIDNLNQIRQAKQKADFVFLVIHGGHEHYSLPSPRMVKQYRFLAENGADAIIGHHSHCPGAYEVHQGVPIFYSLGNLFFPSQTTFSEWYKGMLVQFSIRSSKKLDWQIIPFEQRQKNEATAIHLLDERQKKDFFKQLDQLNKILADPQELQKNWLDFCHSKEELLTRISIPSRLLAKVISKLKLNHLCYFKTHLALMLNLNRCEAHRDVMLQLLKDKTKDRNE